MGRAGRGPRAGPPPPSLLRLPAAEALRNGVEGAREVGGEHPHLGGLAVGDLRQHLQVLVGEQRGGGPAGVDGGEDRGDGLRLALGAQDLGLPGALGAQDLGVLLAAGLQDLGLLLGGGGQDGGLLGALGTLDLRLPLGLGGEDGGALGALGGDLLLHGGQHPRRRLDGLQLHAGDADAPGARRLVEDTAQLLVDRVAAGLGLLQIQGADQVAQRGGGELLDGLDEVRDLVGGVARVGNLVVDDRVDGDHRLVGGDDRLRREVGDLLAQVDARGHAVDEGHQQVEAAVEHRLEAPEALDHVRLGLGDDPHGADQGDDDEYEEKRQDERRHRQTVRCHCLPFTGVPSTARQ